jgi:hypothetical protein
MFRLDVPRVSIPSVLSDTNNSLRVAESVRHVLNELAAQPPTLNMSLRNVVGNAKRALEDRQPVLSSTSALD